MWKEAKKKDAVIEKQHKIDERRLVRKPWTANGKRNTQTYDDVDEVAFNARTKMRVDWAPEEDSMVSVEHLSPEIGPLYIGPQNIGPQYICHQH